MNVLHLIDNLYPGGAERVMVNTCNWLHESGVAVETALISGRGNDLLAALHPAIRVHVLDRKHRADLRAAYRLSTLIAKADIAHVHMRHNFRYAALIAKLLHLNTPLVFHDHFGEVERIPRVPLGFKSFAKPTWYIGVSQTLTSWAEQQLHIPPAQTFLLENTVLAEAPATILPQSTLVLVSNIKPQKNQHFALEWLQHTPWTLDIYGGRQDEAYTQQLEATIQNKGLAGQVRLIHHCYAVQAKLGGYRLGLHTSTHETGPLAIIEYLAQGLPFLSYKTGEAAKKISLEFPEYFIDNLDAREWTERIRNLLSIPADQEKMARVFQRYFSKQAYIKKCLHIYDKVLTS